MTIEHLVDGDPVGWHEKVNDLLGFWDGEAAPTSFGAARTRLNAMATDLTLPTISETDAKSVMTAKINALIDGSEGAEVYLASVTSGFRYGFSDLTRLFTTSTGPTNVSAPGNALGLFLDNREWGGETLADLIASQPNLVVNGDFSAGTAGWTGIGSAGWSVVGGKLTQDGSASSALGVRQGIDFSNTSLYRLEYKVSDRSAGSVRQLLYANGFAAIALSRTADGTFVEYLVPNSSTSSATDTLLIQAIVTPFMGSVDDIIIQHIPGNWALQATGGSRGLYQSGGVLRLATDDGYSTPLLPGRFMMARAMLTGGSGGRIVAGAAGSSTGRFYLGFNASGRAVVRVGDGAEQASGVDRTNIDGTIGLRIRADNTVDLVIDGVVSDSAAMSGVPTTSQPIAIGAANQNGTLGSFFSGDIITGSNGDALIAGDVPPTDAQLAALHKWLMAA